jgi:hypothetical protein
MAQADFYRQPAADIRQVQSRYAAIEEESLALLARWEALEAKQAG